MFNNKRIVLVSLLLALAVVPASADQWLHVRVEDRGPSAENVEVNIPLSVVEAMLPMISIDDLHHGHIQLADLDLDDVDLDEIDLRAVLLELRDGPDTDFVTIRSNDESVRVAKEGDFLVVHVEERTLNDPERVHVKIPLAVVEALLPEGRDELDLLAGLRALGEFEGEDLVRVESNDESIRIWVDSSESGS